MLERKRIPFDQDKFNEAVMYIAVQSETDEAFGAVKLNKILYYADFSAYRKLGMPITGATYFKLNEGPAPRQMLQSRAMMLDLGWIELQARPYFTGVQQRVVVRPELRERALTPLHLSPEEVSILDEVIRFLLPFNGREASDWSHREIGWKVAEYGETIRYETAWLSADEAGQEAEEYGLRLLERK